MVAVINKPVLYLNRLYQPCGIQPLKKALRKLCADYEGTSTRKALILDPETYQTWTWEDWSKINRDPPEIIVLSRYAEVPMHRIPFSRRAIYKRDRLTCQYCGAQPGPGELTIDHVLPRAQGGMSSWENCALACVDCNKRKANRTPQQAGMRLHRQPVRPRFMPVMMTERVASWEKFLGNAYWTTELEP